MEDTTLYCLSCRSERPNSTGTRTFMRSPRGPSLELPHSRPRRVSRRRNPAGGRQRHGSLQWHTAPSSLARCTEFRGPHSQTATPSFSTVHPNATISRGRRVTCRQLIEGPSYGLRLAIGRSNQDVAYVPPIIKVLNLGEGTEHALTTGTRRNQRQFPKATTEDTCYNCTAGSLAKEDIEPGLTLRGY